MSGQFPMYPAMYGQEDQEPYAYGMNVPQPQTMNLNGRSQLLPTINPSLLSPQLSNRSSGMNNDLPQYAHGGHVDRMPYHGGYGQQQHRPMPRPMPMPYHPEPYNMPQQPQGFGGRMPYHGRDYGDAMRQPPQLDYDRGGYQTGGYKPTPEQVQSGYGQGNYQGPMPIYPGGIGGRIPYRQPRMMKKGGLARAAQRVQAAGTDGDTILAHINPLEAAQLAAQSGGASINPHTGLPAYKFKLGKVLKTVAKVAAPFVGGAIAGPMGAAIGGGLAGAIGGGKNKITKGLIGAGLGYVGAGGLGNLGGVGTIIPKVNNAVGLTGLAGKMGLGAAAASNVNKAANVSKSAANGAAAGAGLGSFFGGLDAGTVLPLAGMGILATKAKKVYPKEDSLSEIIKHNKPEWGPDQQYRRMKPLKRALRNLGAEDYLRPGAPELEYFENANPEAEAYAHGGLVHYMANGGHLDGYTGGQDDHIDAKLSDGEYVISADVVSGLGDGNNNAGAKKLDAFMKSVRAHKTSKGAKGLPPKAKSMAAYMQARGVR